MFKNKVRKQIDSQINDLKLYLENNYKDLAIQARKEAIALVNSSFEQGKIKDKIYKGYMKQLDQYTEEMKNYNHQQFYHS